MLAETAASSDKNVPGGTQRISSTHTPEQEAAVKESWMKSIVSALGQFPEFKAAVWFEEIKPEAVLNVELLRDFRITSTDLLTQVFLTSIETSLRENVFVDGTVKTQVYKCTGELNF